MNECDAYELLKNITPVATFVFSVITFFLGFVIRGFTMTAKEKYDINDKHYNYSQELQDKLQDKFKAFDSAMMKILAKYKSKKKLIPSDRSELGNAGEDYFNGLRNMCNSILANKLDKVFIEGEHKHLLDQPENIEKYYKLINKVENQLQIPHQKFIKEKYDSVYKVYNLYFGKKKKFYQFLKLLRLY